MLKFYPTHSLGKKFYNEMTAVGVDVPYCDINDTSIWVMIQVIDWEKFLSHLGYSDNVLIAYAKKRFLFEAIYSNTISNPKKSYYKYKIFVPLPSNFSSTVSTEKFLEIYSPYHPDDIRSKVLLIMLNQYDGIELDKKFRKFFENAVNKIFYGDRNA